MRLYLIRHGETVDNVAGVYAGVKDSDLTNHGFQQATRLGEHFRKENIRFTHIYSSHLQRAYKTAESVWKAQLTIEGIDASKVPEVQRVPLLVEQDFGFYEGKRNIPRPDESGKTGKQDHYEQHRHLPGFKEPETKEAMCMRADAFLDEHLLPLIAADGHEKVNILIVSHGLLMPTLWRRLLLRLPPKSVSIAPEILATRHFYSLEHLGGWSNTGYLLIELQPALEANVASPLAEVLGKGLDTDLSCLQAELPIAKPAPAKLDAWTLQVKAVNNTDHLRGLKRTGGGVGSARHDQGQRSIDTFFKRRKVS